ncbi:MAG: hypothetical protein LBV04_08065 [Deferribacteraceae bacterium]|jgi:outer membrane protein assembly factor BamE (lipoprotein component of BamABCDE complex)|nr:hypothetical protein [Deferribacteraceae bacterium]
MRKLLLIAIVAVFTGCAAAYDPYNCNYDWPNNYYYYRGANLRVGMTAQQVLAQQGEPQRISRFGDTYVKREQWFYSAGYYLYFENGILRAWQNIRR